MYSSYRGKSDKILRSSIIIPLINSATSILAALVLFVFLGHLAVKTGVSLDELPIEGLELAFVVYPALLTMLPGSNLWSVLFFVMLVTVGIDSMFASVDFTVTIIHQIKSRWFGKQIKMWVYTVIYCILQCIIGILFTTKGGYHLFKLFDHYAIGISMIFVTFIQCTIIGWGFGIGNLNKLTKKYTGESIPLFAVIMLRYVVPSLLLVLGVIGFVSECGNPQNYSPGA